MLKKMPEIKRSLSRLSMIVFRATHSSEQTWREECLKYVCLSQLLIKLAFIVLHIRSYIFKVFHVNKIQNFYPHVVMSIKSRIIK